MMLDRAIALASKYFEGVYDKGGKPYILHCLHVMNNVDQNDDELMQIAVLHDIIEDTPVTAHDLTDMGFSDRVVAGVESVTHYDNEPHVEYVSKIAANRDAVQVKLADLRHNSDITRMKGLRDKDFKRLEKYSRMYKFLKEVFDAG